MERFTPARFWTLLVICAVLALAPLILPASLLPEATRVVILAGTAMSLNVLVGSTGLISLGQGMFLGLGAYIVSVGTLKFGLGFWSAAALALGISVPMSLLTALVTLRARHLFFGLLTLGLGQVAFVYVASSYTLTGGDDGLIGVPIPSWLDGDIAHHYASVCVLLVVCLLLLRLLASPFGVMLGAVRDNRDRVAAIGANPKLYEIAAMVIASVLGTLFGVVWVLAEGSVEPSIVSWMTSAILLNMVAIGGRTWFFGPLLGAVLLEASRAAVQVHSAHSDLVVGGVVILCALLCPEGIGSLFKKIVWSRSRQPLAKPDPAAARQPLAGEQR
ncbi:branched-chain amino acid transport system permease protein [Paraburkholderia sp. WC7.3g]|uniref:Branched-chain amino acid ABC transporter permease n=1 Tax=Paraburkholderia podalyriae TaxID=1938811 RepID=A0ABR7PI49_9BURK|nr:MULTISPECIES: branched-chain amino acid ABC transporter permease [Paraburkholderia]MBB5406389.1 branched-chain amino acid transport system permease protein [Paraburkholderia sp. HC6.4b]MBB5448787.1 branched-chain amino acid transport system permease protein [Paraburkholderia sp. Kb1A]MBC8745991.1 branched-chain amino acid ABC transporter permease [Paraburkholderia podalyriae]